jgi:cell division protein YceG involved in septum cleavage
MSEDRSQHLGRSDADRQRERAERARRRLTAEARMARRWRSGPPLTRVLAVLVLLGLVAGVWIAVTRLRSSARHTPTVALPAVVSVLIPEGLTRLQIAERARAAGLSGSYLRASEHSALFDPARYGAPRNTADLEGFLFPATYEMYRAAPASRLVHEQLVTFAENFGPSQIARARDLHLTPYQLLIVASMVEREAQLPGDLPKVAAVIYNRLRLGMALGIDATIYYALERQKRIATYTGELTEAQLHINSPYNTRTHTGLPPTPIANPGAAAIHAAAYPAHVPYLYYVARADGCGGMIFSTTSAEFEANAAAYQAAVKKNGGRPPVCRHG